MVIDVSVNGWEEQLLAEEMNIVKQAMEDKFYDIFLKSYKEYVDKFYSEYIPSVYPRSEQLRNVLPVELKPIVVGNSIECGIDLGQVNRLSHHIWSNNGHTGQHYGNGDEFALKIVDMALNKGSHGGYITTETAPFKEMEKDLTENYSKFEDILKTKLKQAGFTIL